MQLLANVREALLFEHQISNPIQPNSLMAMKTLHSSDDDDSASACRLNCAHDRSTLTGSDADLTQPHEVAGECASASELLKMEPSLSFP